MFPIVSYGGVDVPAYPALILGGLLLCWLLIYRRSLALGWPVVGLVTILFLGLPAGAIGGRVLAAVTQSVLGDGAQAGEYAGMTVLGSIAGVLLFASIAVPRLLKVPRLEFFDAVAFSMPLSMGFGRIGCLALGCCHGESAPSDAPSWLTLPLSGYAPETSPRVLFDPHGVETIWNLPLLFVSQAIVILIAVELHYRFTRDWGPKGTTSALCLVLDALGRTFIEPYRGGTWGLEETQNPWELLTWVYLAIAILVFIGVWGRWLYTRKSDLAASH